MGGGSSGSPRWVRIFRIGPGSVIIFEMSGGKLGGTGCVAYLFERKGVVRVPQAAAGEERLMEVALEAGADDVRLVGDRWEIECEPAAISGVGDALGRAGLAVESTELVRVPGTTVDIDDVDTARRVLELMERLDDHDDVQAVAANFNIPETALAQLG
jgi:transcriptional/translational regulatory protein YebC/TACO1